MPAFWKVEKPRAKAHSMKTRSEDADEDRSIIFWNSLAVTFDGPGRPANLRREVVLKKREEEEETVIRLTFRLSLPRTNRIFDELIHDPGGSHAVERELGEHAHYLLFYHALRVACDGCPPDPKPNKRAL